MFGGNSRGLIWNSRIFIFCAHIIRRKTTTAFQAKTGLDYQMYSSAFPGWGKIQVSYRKSSVLEQYWFEGAATRYCGYFLQISWLGRGELVSNSEPIA